MWKGRGDVPYTEAGDMIGYLLIDLALGTGGCDFASIHLQLIIEAALVLSGHHDYYLTRQ
jgi:hypothetical protein